MYLEYFLGNVYKHIKMCGGIIDIIGSCYEMYGQKMIYLGQYFKYLPN